MLRHGKRLRIFHVYRESRGRERKRGGKRRRGKKGAVKAGKKGEERKKKGKRGQK